MSDRTYFKVEKGSHAEKAWISFRKKDDEVWKSWLDFAKKYGVDSLFAGDCVSGLVFENIKPPEGWVSLKKMPSNVFKPARKKICMTAYDEMNNLSSKPSGHAFAKLLEIDCVFSGMSMYMPGMDKIGDEYILTLHPDSVIPEGAIPLKMSEYWELKEAI